MEEHGRLLNEEMKRVQVEMHSAMEQMKNEMQRVGAELQRVMEEFHRERSNPRKFGRNCDHARAHSAIEEAQASAREEEAPAQAAGNRGCACQA